MSAGHRLAAAIAAVSLSLLAIPAAITPASARGEVVAFNAQANAGTIVVRTNERRLYLVLGPRPRDDLSGRRRPRRHAVAGSRVIDSKHIRPAWAPPPDIKRENPGCPTSSPAARRTIRWASPR